MRLERVGREVALLWSVADGPTIEMARHSKSKNLLRIFPRLKNADGFEPQFSQVTELRIRTLHLSRWDPDEVVGESDHVDGWLQLDGLPDGFGAIFAFGLGLKRPFRPLIHVIEDHTDCTVVEFGSAEGPNGNVFKVSLPRFEAYRRAAVRNQQRGRTVVGRVNQAEAHNSVAGLLGVKTTEPTWGKHPLIRRMTSEVTGELILADSERAVLLDQVTAESRQVATDSPTRFGKLRHDLDLVTLEVLIEQFNDGLHGRTAKDERHWQTFFETNSFALQQVFAAPVALFGAQLHVKGGNAKGAGARIADFMLINTVTRNALVVEIKTPGAGLVGSVYRGAGGAEVVLPHRDLLGAVAQVQAQMQSTHEHLPTLLRDTPDAAELDTTSVRGAVIVGTAAGLTSEQKASFVRYREGLNGVEVVAFDELRDRLTTLHELLSDGSESVGSG